MKTIPAMPRISKLQRLRDCWAAGDRIGALRICVKFPSLGAEKEAIHRGWNAHQHPDTYRAMGHEPEQLLTAALRAMAAKYDLGN